MGNVAGDDLAAIMQTYAQQQASQNAALGLDPNGKPLKPGYIGLGDYHGITDANGNLQSQYQLGNSYGINARQIQDTFQTPTYEIPTFDRVNMDQTAVNAIKDRAMSSGLTPWATMLRQQQAEGQQTQLDSAQAQSASARAQSLGDLSRLGGLSGGARERVANQNQKDNMFQQNAIRRQGMSDVTNIGLADEAQKAQLLQAIPGYDAQNAGLALQNNAFLSGINQFNAGQKTNTSQFNANQARQIAQYNTDALSSTDKYNSTMAEQIAQFNLGNSIKDVGSKNLWAAQNNQGLNSYNETTYGQQMQAWAAEQQANATKAQAENSGGSWLCTEANKSLHFEEAQKKILSKFMREALKLDRETTRFYLFRCDPLILKMKEKGANWNKNAAFVLNILSLMQENKTSEAFDLYCDYTINCIEKYWPECRDPSFLRIQQIRKNFLESKGA